MEFKLTKHLDKQFVDRYIDFLEEKGSTLFYQSPVFHRFLKNHLNSDLYYFLWLRKNKIVASFPFMVKRNEKVGGVLNSLPYYGSNGSLVFSHSAKGDEKNKIRNDLKDRLNSFYKDQDIVLSTLISNPLEKEEMEWLRGNWRADFKDYRIGQITELPDYSETFEDDLFDLYDNPRPRNIRRAMITVKAGEGIRLETISQGRESGNQRENAKAAANNRARLSATNRAKQKFEKKMTETTDKLTLHSTPTRPWASAAWTSPPRRRSR